MLAACSQSTPPNQTAEAQKNLGPLALATVNEVSDLTPTRATNGWGPVEKNKSNGEAAAGDGRTLSIGGSPYSRGLGVHANSALSYDLGGVCTQFTGEVGIDDEVGNRGSVVFQVFGDGTKLYDSGTLTGADTRKVVNIRVAGVQQFRLVVTDAGDGNAYDHADWAIPRLFCNPQSASSTINVDRAFDSLNNAFLVKNGDARYYKESLNVLSKDYFWRQALDIQVAEDVYVRTGKPEHRALIASLLDTFLQQNQGRSGLYDWDWNEYNDDLLWAGLAFVRGYKITGNVVYLNQAKYAFNRVYDRGWDNALGGGIWWDIRRNDKSALSNSPAVILGILIYESSGEKPYMDKASAIYDWVWANLVDRTTGGVHETKRANGELDSGQNVYTAGAFVSAAQALYRNTGRPSVYADAKRTVDWVIRERTNSSGVMTNGQREGTWQSEFARGVGEFVRENNLWDQYYDWMKRNADAAWSVRRRDLNVSWNRWDAQTPTDDTRAVEAIGAVAMQAVTPDVEP